ncbi:MAG: class I SAM-dependent methyltransferase [Bryobacterales bacterium]|nr:class I SAM-dependent methyltransferase [Bryobacterales bacterium]
MQQHWEHVYETKAPDEVSWYRPHLETSLQLVERAAQGIGEPSIIDVGGGASTLVDDLVSRGFAQVTVLDISRRALEVARQRMGAAENCVTWLHADVLHATFAEHAYDVWHDRAVFHFLTMEEERRRYVLQVAQAVKQGGYVIVSTFGAEGPRKCSGLDAMRYDAEGLHAQFGTRFRLVESCEERHDTPFGTQQQFLYCLCRVEG